MDTLRALTAAVEADQQVQADVGNTDIYEVLQEFLNANVIARRPAHSPHYDDLTEALLYFIVRLCRRGIPKNTSNVDNIERLCDKELGLVMPLVQLMAEHMNHHGVSQWGCWLFAVLSSDSTDRQKLLDSCGATMVAAFAIHRHREHALPSAMAARAIRNLGCVDEIAAKFVQEGSCEGLLQLVTQGKNKEGMTHEDEPIRWNSEESEEALECALWGLVNLTCDTQIATIVGSVGGITTIVELLEERKNDETFNGSLHAALSLIRNLSSAGSYNYNILNNTDVCQLAHFILNKFYGQDVNAAEIALYLLSNLACFPPLSKKIGELDGCFETVLKVMHHFTSMAMYTANLQCGEAEDDGVVEAALWAVQNLCYNSKDNQAKFVDLGSLGMVANTIQYYPTQHANICATISRIVEDNDIAKHEAGKQFYLNDLSVQMIDANITDIPVCGNGCKLLKDLCIGNKFNFDRLVHLNVIALAVRIMKLHSDQMQVTLPCCELLLHVHYSRNEEAKSRLIKEGMVEIGDGGKLIIKAGKNNGNNKSDDVADKGKEEEDEGEEKEEEDKDYSYQEIYDSWVNADPVLRELKESQIEEFEWPFHDMKLLFGKYVDQRCADNLERRKIFTLITSISNESMLNQRVQRTILSNIDFSKKEGIVEKVQNLVEIANEDYRNILILDR